MKTFTLAALLMATGICTTAVAAAPDNIAVYSTQTSNGSVSVGGKNSYTKTFEVVVANLSQQDVTLSKLCLKAYSPDKKEFKLDTVDEELSTGTLKPGDSVKSTAVFASSDADVYKAALIEISDNCK